MRIIKRVLSSVLTSVLVLGSVVSPIMAIDSPDSSVVNRPDIIDVASIHDAEHNITYQEVKGYAQKIEERNGYKYMYVTSEYEKGNVQESYFVISDKTVVIGDIESGVEVVGIYDARLPMLMIYPPQYPVLAVKAIEEGVSVKVDKFDNFMGDGRLLSEDRSLVINLGKDTPVLDSKGNSYTEDLMGKTLYIEYDIVLESYPLQTTPKVIIVLDLEEADKVELNDIKVIRDSLEKEKGIVRDNDFHGNIMNNLGIIQGTEKGLELDRGLTRVEGAVMFSRLLGLQDKIEKFSLENPDYKSEFNDIPEWAKPTINYLEANGLVKGIGNNKYGSDRFMTETEYATLILRALGYSDELGDFQWNTAKDKVKEIGMYDLDEIKPEEILGGSFTRRGMAYMSYNALYLENKLDGELLLYKLLK